MRIDKAIEKGSMNDDVCDCGVEYCMYATCFLFYVIFCSPTICHHLMFSMDGQRKDLAIVAYET